MIFQQTLFPINYQIAIQYGYSVICPNFYNYQADYSIDSNVFPMLTAQERKSKQIRAKIEELGQYEKKASTIVKIEALEPDYRPKKKILMKSGQKILRQTLESSKAKFNKNVLPNNVNIILSYLRRANKSGRVVQRIVEREGLEGFSAKKFYSYQAYLKEKLAYLKTNYVLDKLICHEDSACPVFSLVEQKFYNKVTRILVKNFVASEGKAGLLASSKIRQTSKIEHLQVLRLLSHKLFCA